MGTRTILKQICSAIWRFVSRPFSINPNVDAAGMHPAPPADEPPNRCSSGLPPLCDARAGDRAEWYDYSYMSRTAPKSRFHGRGHDR